MSGETWDVVFDRFDPADEHRREALLALGNGALLTRGAAATGGTGGYPGFYRAGLYDRRDEVVGGERLAHDVLVRLPDWLPVRVRVDGEAGWLSPETAELLEYRHALDTTRGVSCRDMLLRDGAGRQVRLREHRLVSMARSRLAALRLEITPIGWDGTVEVCSALDGAVENGNWPQEMPGSHRLLAPPAPERVAPGLLMVRTTLRHAGLALVLAARTAVMAEDVVGREAAAADRYTCRAGAGQTIAVEKVAALSTVRDPASFEPAEAALDMLRHAPEFAELLLEHQVAWARLWERCRLRAGDPPLERALRLHAFHLLQSACEHTVELDAGLPARGWQEAYAGHIFWDATFSFPVLALRVPAVARALLLYRFRRLGAARRAAAAAGLGGALFPWRSASTGREETPALQPNPLDGDWLSDNTRLARHVSLAIARDIRTYVLATGDMEFLALYGGEMLVEIARFWASLARPAADGRFDIEGVTGPDEFHTALPGAAAAGLATNAYTNVLASSVLARTPELLDMLPEPRRDALFHGLRLQPKEPERWALLSRRLALAFHGDGILSQFRGYGDLRPLDTVRLARAHPGQRTDLALQAEGESPNAYQIGKQPDVLMLPYLLPGAQLRQALEHMGYPMSDEQLARTARFYLERTVHDSSLSRIGCAGALAHLDPGQSWTLYNEALDLDLDPASGCGASEGLHLGTMAATLDVMQRIYLGLEVDKDGLVLAPSIPPGLPAIEMRLFHRGSALDLEWTGACLRLRSDPANAAPVNVRLDGTVRTLQPGGVETFDPASLLDAAGEKRRGPD